MRDFLHHEAGPLEQRANRGLRVPGTEAAEAGAIIFPPAPAFYGKPQTVDDIVDGTVGRVLLRAGIENELYTKWVGMKGT